MTVIVELVTFLLSTGLPADSIEHIVDLTEQHARKSVERHAASRVTRHVTQRDAARERSRRYRARKRDASRSVTRDARDADLEKSTTYVETSRVTRDVGVTPDKERRSPTPPKERNSASGEADASPPASAPLRGAREEVDLLAQQNWQPVYADSRHELWGEGVPILEQLGVPLDRARRQIGRWLRDLHDDAQQVLGAIQRARDNRVIDPVPWITRALRTNGSSRGPPRSSGGNPFAEMVAKDLGIGRYGYKSGDDDDLTLDLRPIT